MHLVLSVLCDFKGKNELDVLLYITKRLKELTQDNEYILRKYMIMLETLSQNRDLQNKLKEAEEMLRDIEIEKLPSYQIGNERGFRLGEEKGIKIGKESGIKIGEKKGIAVGIELMAKNMLNKNIDIKTIKEITGLSKKDIEKLK